MSTQKDNKKMNFFQMLLLILKYFFDRLSEPTWYTKYCNNQSNNKSNNSLEKKMNAYGLTEFEKKLVRSGKQSTESFDTDDSSDEDDYYHDDDE
jgi:hypothetical protein